jgi:hypothetical protein
MQGCGSLVNSVLGLPTAFAITEESHALVQLQVLHTSRITFTAIGSLWRRAVDDMRCVYLEPAFGLVEIGG